MALEAETARKAALKRHGMAALLGAATLVVFTVVSQAQDNAGRPPVLPPQPGTGVPEKVDPSLQPGKDGEVTGTLSQKLNQSEGVIHPPSGVDPEIRVPPPSTGGTMPIIPPPGEPGGSQAIQPK